jgi:hypothetical protein
VTEVPIVGTRGAEGPVPESITYRFVGYRALTFIIFVGLGLGAVAMVVNQLSGGVGPGPVFVVLWVAAYLWGAYWFLFRIAFEVGVVDGSILRWRFITSRHEIPLTHVRGISTPFPPFGYGSKRIAVEGDRSPFIVANQGYRDVIAMIVQFRPDLVVPNTRSDRFFERFAQRSVWWRRV